MGIGTQEIIKACVDAGMKEPEFYEQAGAFVVKLWSRHFQLPLGGSELSNRQISILALLKEGPLSPKDILSQLKQNISDRTLRNDLQSLKALGYIETTGKGKQTKWFLKMNAEKNPETRK